MAYVIVVLLGTLLASWVWLEYNSNNPTMRVAAGVAIVVVLCVVIYSSYSSSFYRNAHNMAAFRMLGETLENGEYELARDAMRHYRDQEPRQSGYVIVRFLGDRQEDQKRD